MRGSGPAGIAGIGSVRRFGHGWLVRPLLYFDRSELKDYAEAEGIQWIDDPSNKDRRFDRNFLRHEILPRLKERWPDIATRLQRSAQHASEATGLLIDLDHLLADPVFDPNRCSIGFHPLHSYLALGIYTALLFPKQTRIFGIALVIHILADSVDCWLLAIGF